MDFLFHTQPTCGKEISVARSIDFDFLQMYFNTHSPTRVWLALSDLLHTDSPSFLFLFFLISHTRELLLLFLRSGC